MSSPIPLLTASLWLLPLLATSAPIAKKPLTIIRPSTDLAITLTAGHLTTGYRTKRIPQLACVYGSCDRQITTVQCYDRGQEGRDIQWECKTTDLPDGYKLEVVEVNCEAYPDQDGPDIVQGSCGLRYGITGGETKNTADVVVAIIVGIILLGVCIAGLACCCMATHSSGGIVGHPMMAGYPYYGPGFGYGYYGDGGFGTGMMTGYMIGNMGHMGGGCSPGFGGGGFSGGDFGGGGGHVATGFGHTTFR